MIRSAFGIFYAGVYTLTNDTQSPGYSLLQNYNQNGSGHTEPFSLEQGMPVNPALTLTNPAAILASATPSSPISAPTQTGDISPAPSMQQWNFGVQQDLGKGFIFEANYVGNHSLHLGVSQNANEPPFSQGLQLASPGRHHDSERSSVPEDIFRAINEYNDAADGEYEALQLTGRRQFSSNLAFLTFYSWSKSVDDSIRTQQHGQPNGGADLNGQFPNYFLNLEHAPERI